MSKIYIHNPRCSKSRQGLNILSEKGIKFEIHEYLKTPLTKKSRGYIRSADKNLFSERVYENQRKVI